MAKQKRVTEETGEAQIGVGGPVGELTDEMLQVMKDNSEQLDQLLPAAPHRLEAPYAYYEDDGTLKNWAHGQILTDPAEIEHLKDRGARLVPHEVES